MLASGLDSAKEVTTVGKGISLSKRQQHDLSISQRLTKGLLQNRGNMGITSKSLDKKINLNVGGTKHETWASTLEMIPGTRLALLAHLQEADESYDFDSDEYFFDRHPTAFECVIQYYRTEELHVNQSLCGNIMKAELQYWGIEEQDIEPCCWAEYSKFTEHKETLKDLDDNFFYADEDLQDEVHVGKWKNFVAQTWRLLEEPASSIWAKVYAVTSMFFVALSIAIFVLETHKLFQVDATSGISMNTLLPEDEATPTDKDCCCENDKGNKTSLYTPVTHPAMRILDYICVGFFALEFIVRIAFCPNKLRFWRSALNIIDLVCLIPHFTSIIMSELEPENETSDLVKTILMLRIVRILRIFKLMKHYSAFKILVYTIKVSTRELLLMIVFLMSGVLMFASIIHYAEKDNFPNIPIGIWWALVTMTTVGYGDKYPVGYIGFVVGSVCVICGVLVIAFTVPIVVNNFSLYYSHAQTRIKIPKRSKQKKAFKGPPGKKARAQSGVSTSTNDTDFNAIPEFTPRGDKAKLVNPAKQQKLGQKMNDLNKNTDEKKKLNTQMSPNKGKQEEAVPHGKDSGKTAIATPVESNEIQMEDLESIDSGIDDAQHQKKQFEEQTRKIMDDLVNNDQKLADERKRQEWLIKQKRERRAKAAQQQKEEASQTIDGKSDQNVRYKGERRN